MHVEYTAGVGEVVQCVSDAIFLGWVVAIYSGDVWFEGGNNYPVGVGWEWCINKVCKLGSHVELLDDSELEEECECKGHDGGAVVGLGL